MKMDFQKAFTKDDILNQLASLGAPRDSIVLMHSSFSLVGNVEGGAKALLDALIEYFTRDGGLFCIPTHTWHNLDKDITLDMNDSGTCLGLLPDLAAADERGIRSQNPTHSMVVFGDRERALDHKVGRGIACMQGNDELRGDGAFVFTHVAADEFKAVKVKRAGALVTMLDHVGLEIYARHRNGVAKHVCKIMVDGEGEIAFSAAKITDADLALRQRRKRIAHKLQKAVDLTELCALFVVNTSVFICYVKEL